MDGNSVAGGLFVAIVAAGLAAAFSPALALPAAVVAFLLVQRR